MLCRRAVRAAVTKAPRASSLFPELYFLIAKFLDAGICPEAAKVSERIVRATARLCDRATRTRHSRVHSTRFVSGAEAGIGACRGKPYGGPDTVHNASCRPHGSHVVSACQNIRISRSLTLLDRQVSRPSRGTRSALVDRIADRSA